MEKVMEQLKQELQQKLERELNFTIKETEDVAPQTLNCYISGFESPFMAISTTDKIEICFFLEGNRFFPQIERKAIPPQITVSYENGNFNIHTERLDIKSIDVNGGIKQDSQETVISVFEIIKNKIQQFYGLN